MNVEWFNVYVTHCVKPSNAQQIQKEREGHWHYLTVYKLKTTCI